MSDADSVIVGRLRPPDGGYAALKVTADSLTIIERAPRRFLWFWKRCCTRALASVPCRVKQGSTVSLMRMGADGYVVLVDNDVVLTWPPDRSGYRGVGFGMAGA